MATKPPAFQFYAQDFLTGTSEMTNAEVGAYIRMLANSWIKEGITSDIKKITMMCSGDNEGVEAAMEKFKICEDGRLRNDKLEKVRIAQDGFRNAKKEAGRISAEKRWGSNKSIGDPYKKCNTPMISLVTEGVTKSNSSSSTSSSTSFVVIKEPPQQIPSFKEVKEYFYTQRPIEWSEGKLQIEPLVFFDHYESVGWVINGNPIQNWHATVRKWIRNDKNRDPKQKYNQSEPEISTKEALQKQRELSSKYD